MKLNLKSRKHELEINGEKFTVSVRPLTLLQFQELLSLIASDDSLSLTELNLKKILFRVARDPSAGKMIIALLGAVVKLDTQFTVETDEGERPGDLADLLTGVTGLAKVAELFGYVLGAGTLTETEAKN